MRGRILALLVAAACVSPVPARAEGQRYRDEVFTDLRITTDYVYGEAPNNAAIRGCAAAGDQPVIALMLDVIEPAGDDAPLRAGYVWVHGGYFKRGSKGDDYERSHRESMARAGYVVFDINYRLDKCAPEGAGPAFTEQELDRYIDVMFDAQHDAQAAVRWVRANASAFRIDPERVAIGGHSAGGIISVMVAYNSDDVGTSGNPGWDSRVAAAVPHAGGGAPVRHVHIDAGEPPILFVHGLVDNVVPYPATLLSCVPTLVLQNVCEEVIDPDQGHGLYGPEYDRDFLYRWLYARPGLRVPARVTIRQ
jgi:acetyl esterase/lipase